MYRGNLVDIYPAYLIGHANNNISVQCERQEETRQANPQMLRHSKEDLIPKQRKGHSPINLLHDVLENGIWPEFEEVCHAWLTYRIPRESHSSNRACKRMRGILQLQILLLPLAAVVQVLEGPATKVFLFIVQA